MANNTVLYIEKLLKRIDIECSHHTHTHKYVNYVKWGVN